MHNSGIHKKRKHKQVTRGQRVRREKGLSRAEAVQDQLGSKIADSKFRLKKRQGRKALWDDINSTSKDEARKAIKGPGRFDMLKDDDETENDPILEPYHGDTEIKVIDGVQVPAFAVGIPMTISGRPGPAMQKKAEKEDIT